MIKGYQCDNPNCKTSVHSKEMYISSGFLKIDWMGKSYDFCSWDCTIRYGARFEPMLVVNA